MRRSIVFAMLLAVCQAPIPMPGQATRTTNQGGNEAQEERKAQNTITPKPPPIREDNKTPAPTENRAQIAAQNPEYNVKLTGLPPVAIADKNKTVWDHVFDWGPWVFSLLLVVVGAIGVGLAHRTLQTFDRQAEIMNLQADLMKANMAQWVSFTNWRATPVNRVGPLSKEPRTLRIDFDIINPSDFPLTLKGVFKLNGLLPGAPQIMVPRGFIRPNHPLTVGADVLMADHQAKEYAAEGARISLHGEYFHIGPSKERSPVMEIHANIVCRHGQPTVSEYEATYEKEDEKQS